MQNGIVMKIAGEDRRINVKEGVIESLPKKDLEAIVGETRRVAEIMMENGRSDKLDLKHLFESQVEIHAKNKDRLDEYARYQEVMETLGNGKHPITFIDYICRRGIKGDNTEFIDCIDYILSQGWKKGTLVRHKKGGAPLRVSCISIQGKLVLEGKSGNFNPRHYETYEAKT